MAETDARGAWRSPPAFLRPFRNWVRAHPAAAGVAVAALMVAMAYVRTCGGFGGDDRGFAPLVFLMMLLQFPLVELAYERIRSTRSETFAQACAGSIFLLALAAGWALYFGFRAVCAG